MHTSAKRVVCEIIVLAMLASLAGCAWVGISMGRDPMPRKPGLYAVENERLQRLDGDREWEMKTWSERSNLSPDLAFVIRHPRLGVAGVSPDKEINLSKVAWVRSEITQDGEIVPVDGPAWAVTDIQGFRIPIAVDTHDTKKGVVRVTPARPLEPGLYSLQLSTDSAPVSARLGVGWDVVDRRAYSAANCVDRYAGDKVRYRPCADQEQALAAKWLRIHLVDPEARGIGGQRKVIVRGVVVNASQRPRSVPMLEAHLRGAGGAVLKRWQFQVDAGELAPGASGRFRSEIPNPPPGTQDVHVTFASGGLPAPGVQRHETPSILH